MLKDKILNNKPLMIYSQSAAKSTFDEENLIRTANIQSKRINKLPIDALILYDLQDESSRNPKDRPFEQIQTIEPTIYAEKYLKVKNEKIIYRAVGKYTKENFISWLNAKHTKYSVFVGFPSSKQKQNLSIKDAFLLKDKYYPSLIVGTIAIAERHKIKNDEHLRMIEKIKLGSDFFVTQAIYDVDLSLELLNDYKKQIEKEKIKPKPIIFTFAPCGLIHTISFLRWLGISISDENYNKLKNSKNMIQTSYDLCYTNFVALQKEAKKLNIPIGCNVESVAIRKSEIQAAVDLVQNISKIL